MTDKTEKSLKILSIVLPAAIILLLAVVIGLVLSSAFRIFDLIKKESEETHRTVILGELAIPVSDDILVDHTASVREYLDGLLQEDSMEQGRFTEGIRRHHEEGTDPISLKDLTAYDYDEFADFLDSYGHRTIGQPSRLTETVANLHQIYPIEMLTPVDDDTVFIIYRLLDGRREVYIYLDCYPAQAADDPGFSEWCVNMYGYYVTKRLSYADAESVQTGDSLKTLAKRFPALSYQIQDSRLQSPLAVMMEEGILYLFLPEESRKRKYNHGLTLSQWMDETTFEDMIFIPFGDVLSEEEKAALIERNSKYESFMKYSSVPYVLLPE
ncbi:MAG: hypothetical protein J6K29_06310 [Clostridia bacterium]|nr:hypothetical protein [Clostridia bacterium]